MTFSLLPLLIHDDDVPVTARVALRRANLAPELAARALTRDANLDCEDARELVGL